MNAASDPGSLDRLHDIIAPPVPWWPPALGWFVLSALLLVLLTTVAWQAAAAWRRNRYRREALAEISRIEAGADDGQKLSQLAELVKRVGLATYSREQVASLTGDDWLQFLDRSGATTAFTRCPGQVLETYYQPGPHAVSAELLAAVRRWIKHHRRGVPC